MQTFKARKIKPLRREGKPDVAIIQVVDKNGGPINFQLYRQVGPTYFEWLLLSATNEAAAVVEAEALAMATDFFERDVEWRESTYWLKKVLEAADDDSQMTVFQY